MGVWLLPALLLLQEPWTGNRTTQGLLLHRLLCNLWLLSIRITSCGSAQYVPLIFENRYVALSP